jgi:hypothetical protein
MSEENQVPPIKIAFIIDNEVVDILHTDERLAAIFLSEPKMVDVTGQLVENEGVVRVSSKYNPDTNTFYNEDEVN